MAEVTSSNVKTGIQRDSENKFRRSLKTLQVCADEQQLTGDNSFHDKIKSLKMSSKEKKSKVVEKLPIEEKENVVRRSKRKTAAEKVYTESPVDPKVVKSKPKNAGKTKKQSKTGQSTTVKKNVQKGSLNQKKLDFTTVKSDATIIKQENSLPQFTNEEKLNISAIVNEDSGFDPTCRISDESPLHSTVFQSPVLHSDISIITSANPPLTYWKELAEKRRLALEKALHENELLHDQLTVLEAENSQLKQVARRAEDLADILKAIVD